MCSLQRESVFALPNLTGFTLKILIFALKKIGGGKEHIHEDLLSFGKCDWKEYLFLSEGTILFNFFCEEDKFGPKTK